MLCIESERGIIKAPFSSSTKIRDFVTNMCTSGNLTKEAISEIYIGRSYRNQDCSLVITPDLFDSEEFLADYVKRKLGYPIQRCSVFSVKGGIPENQPENNESSCRLC